jgi:hypothetical protein
LIQSKKIISVVDLKNSEEEKMNPKKRKKSIIVQPIIKSQHQIPSNNPSQFQI